MGIAELPEREPSEQASVPARTDGSSRRVALTTLALTLTNGLSVLWKTQATHRGVTAAGFALSLAPDRKGDSLFAALMSHGTESASPPPPSPSATWSAADTATVGVAAAGAITNTGEVSLPWSFASQANLTITPSAGTLAAGGTQPLSIVAAAAATYVMTLVSAGASITGNDQTMVATVAAVAPTTATLSVASATATAGGSGVLVYVTLDQPAPVGGIPCTVTHSGSSALPAITVAAGQTVGSALLTDAAAEVVTLNLTATTPALTLAGNPKTVTFSASDVGTLVHDGPATPEQVSLWLPLSSGVPQTATATCRYRIAGAGAWTTGHSLYRVQPQWSDVPSVGGAVQDGFAWPIIDLAPGATYEIEVTVSYASTTVVRSLTHTTRTLPAPAGTPNKTATNLSELTTQLASLVAGDVLEIAAGTYTLPSGGTPFLITKAGTELAPIYIRGASRTGTILRLTPGSAGTLIQLLGAQRIVFENMTLQGSGDHTQYSRSFSAHDESLNNYITVRNIVASGFSSFVYAQSIDQVDGEIGMVGSLVYDNTVEGVCAWSRAPVDFLGTSQSWGNDGININGAGSCAWNNTIKGFGDTFACATHAGDQSYTSARGVHIYRNEIRNSCDDSFEVDYGRRNITFYDNRITNCVNAVSFDPLHGGPYLHARNIYINLWRKRPWKWNTFGSGFFIYNNTLIMGANAEGNDWGSYISGGGGAIYHRNYGYRNNVFVWQGGDTSKIIFYHENTTHTPIDWDHNCHWPDAQIRFGGMPTNEPNLAGVLANWPASTPIFSSATKRFESDAILASAQPFSASITLGADANVEVLTTYTPAFASGVAKNTGAAIANVTDGYSGAAPDRGAVIEGRSAPSRGDQTGVVPAYIADLVPYQVRKLTGAYAPTNGKETPLSVQPDEWTASSLPGVGGCIAEYSGGAKSSDRLRVIGGGHGNGAFNGVLSFDPGGGGASRPVGWSVYGLSAVADVLADAEAYADGRAPSFHTYDAIFETAAGVIYLVAGGFRYGSGSSSRRMWKIKPGVFDWAYIGDFDSNPNLIGPPSAIYDPVTNKAFCVSQNPYVNQGKFLRCADDTLSAGKAMAHALDGEPATAWDPTRSRALFLGATKALWLSIDFSAETVSTSVISTLGALIGRGLSVIYDAANDRFVAFGGKSGVSGNWTTAWEISADAATVTPRSLTGDSRTVQNQVFSSGRWAYVPAWRAVIECSGYNQPASVMRI